MSRTAQEAAAARAAAAKNEATSSRLTALEVERQGYVQRGNEDGVAAVDEEIARYSRELGIPLAASTAPSPDSEGEPGPDIEEAKAILRPLVIEILQEAGVLGDPEPTPEPEPSPVVPDPVDSTDPKVPTEPTEPTGDVVPDPAPAPESKRRPRRSAAVAADEPAES